MADLIADESALQMRDNARSRRLDREVYDISLLVTDPDSWLVWRVVYLADDSMYIEGRYSR